MNKIDNKYNLGVVLNYTFSVMTVEQERSYSSQELYNFQTDILLRPKNDVNHLNMPHMINSEAEIQVQNSLDIISKEYLGPSEHIQNLTDLHLVNTRIWINELKDKYGQEITIGTVPKDEWTKLFEKYNAFWFMGIYQPSEASRAHCKKYPDSVAYAKKHVDPEVDIVASPFAIPEYEPNKHIAKDWQEWDTVVEMLHQNGKKVVLDFVPNHVALDHPWSINHPDFFIQGTEEQYQKCKDMYYPVADNNGEVHYLAHGKDPNYPQWADTLQLNYTNPHLQIAMQEVLMGDTGLVHHCDGVRCDMAMLLNPETFLRTWGDKYFGGHLTDQEIQYLRNNEFWPRVIPQVKQKAKELGKEDFIFIAEAYWELDKLGENFDVLYSKNFYEDLVRLRKGDSKISPDDIKWHINFLINGRKECKRQYKMALFTENHDEERSVSTFGKEASKAAAVITSLIPDNIFLMNQGQDEGRHIRPPMQLDSPTETDIDPVDESFKLFYDRLIRLKNTRLFQEGEWSVLRPGSFENPYVIGEKVVSKDKKISAIVCTNFSDNTAIGHLSDIAHSSEVKVTSITSGNDISNVDQNRQGGLFVELKPWESQVVIYNNTPNLS